MSKELIGRLVKLKNPEFDRVDNLETEEFFPGDQVYQIVALDKERKRCALTFEPTDPVRTFNGRDIMDGFEYEFALDNKLVNFYYDTKRLVLLPERKLKTLPVDKALAKMRKLIK